MENRCRPAWPSVFVHEMREGGTGDLAAVCELTAVHMDRTVRKSCPFPEAIRTVAEAAMEASEKILA